MTMFVCALVIGNRLSGGRKIIFCLHLFAQISATTIIVFLLWILFPFSCCICVCVCVLFALCLYCDQLFRYSKTHGGKKQYEQFAYRLNLYNYFCALGSKALKTKQIAYVCIYFKRAQHVQIYYKKRYAFLSIPFHLNNRQQIFFFFSSLTNKFENTFI